MGPIKKTLNPESEKSRKEGPKGRPAFPFDLVLAAGTDARYLRVRTKLPSDFLRPIQEAQRNGLEKKEEEEKIR